MNSFEIKALQGMKGKKSEKSLAVFYKNPELILCKMLRKKLGRCEIGIFAGWIDAEPGALGRQKVKLMVE